MFKSLKASLTAVLLALGTSSAGAAALQSQYGVLDLTANGGINPNTGVAWVAGDQYRLAFHTLGTINATSNDPGVYDAFATAQAQSSGLGNGAITTSTGWTAMVWVNTDPNQAQGAALSSPLVRSGTSDQTGGAGQGGAGVPVYAMDGSTAIARNNADIYNSWSNPFEDIVAGVIVANASGTGNNVIRIIEGVVGGNNDPHYSPFLDQNGNQTVNPDAIHGKTNWTGGFGAHVNALGDTIDNIQSSNGNSNANNTGRVWNRFTGNNTDLNGVYVISELLTISEVPEPSSLALLGMGGLLIARRRRG